MPQPDACPAAFETDFTGGVLQLCEGPRPELIETYAAARDAYEDAVEEFGALRTIAQEAPDTLRPS